ncbi:MAG: SlyX family protein [Maritimibacter harenae]|uniref:SlyX protein n=1 Tax=Maritimibacter harenae TaxID=2606218 RepID=A0A845LX65_9RHOB|nr:SlyX family protein [Maritimibacter harenae]MZR12540.1 SlyX protein [Maritimibacter harenae]
MTDRITDLEEQVAYLSRTVDDLSEVIARQDRTLDTVTRRLQLLMERAAEQELDAGGTVPLADQKPPHW